MTATLDARWRQARRAYDRSRCLRRSPRGTRVILTAAAASALQPGIHHHGLTPWRNYKGAAVFIAAPPALWSKPSEGRCSPRCGLTARLRALSCAAAEVDGRCGAIGGACGHAAVQGRRVEAVVLRVGSAWQVSDGNGVGRRSPRCRPVRLPRVDVTEGLRMARALPVHRKAPAAATRASRQSASRQQQRRRVGGRAARRPRRFERQATSATKRSFPGRATPADDVYRGDQRWRARTRGELKGGNPTTLSVSDLGHASAYEGSA